MSNTKPRVPRLGRGLSSLMGRPVVVDTPAPGTPGSPASPPAISAPPVSPASPSAAASAVAESVAAVDRVILLPLSEVRPSSHQPRQQFDEPALARLAESIRSEGVIQPIVVRRSAKGESHYELVAGERRWRAARLAGLDAVPAIVRDLDDRQVAEWALVENLQREDLNPIERAEAFQHLMTHFHLSHEQVAQRVGVERSSISNALRLLGLHADVRAWVREGRLSAGQAKVLAGVTQPEQQKSLAEKALRHDWSVRQVEQAVRHATGATADAAAGESAPRAMATRSAHLSDLEEQVGRQLSTKVHIRAGRRKGSGTLTIEFYSLDQFDALMNQLGVKTEE